jgi:3-oxoacyl-[acyl-carrier protein] reductase
MGRTIVITGASSQIGRAIVDQIVQSEDRLVVHCCKHADRLSAVQERFGSRCRIIVADFTDDSQTTAFCEQLPDTDVLINAAALTYSDLLVNLEDTSIVRMMKVNIYAIVKICRKVLPSMVAGRTGTIVNISSVTATRGNRGQSVYAGTKGFIESFTRCLAAEYGPRGIRTNAVAPGPIEAGSLGEIMGYAPDEVKNSTALKRTGTPREVASVVAFLISSQASFINGKIIGVDGGFLKGI